MLSFALMYDTHKLDSYTTPMNSDKLRLFVKMYDEAHFIDHRLKIYKTTLRANKATYIYLNEKILSHLPFI